VAGKSPVTQASRQVNRKHTLDKPRSGKSSARVPRPSSIADHRAVPRTPWPVSGVARHSRPWQATWTVRAEPSLGCTGVEPSPGHTILPQSPRWGVDSALCAAVAGAHMCRALAGLHSPQSPHQGVEVYAEPSPGCGCAKPSQGCTFQRALPKLWFGIAFSRPLHCPPLFQINLTSPPRHPKPTPPPAPTAPHAESPPPRPNPYASSSTTPADTNNGS
jgi:hypothetical protein